MIDLPEPTLADVLDARRVISPYVHRTPLRRYPALSAALDADVWVKHENFQILGSFKVRGGLNLVSKTSPAESARGFITASSGNHGQSIAFAARTFGSAATVVVPEDANPVKVNAMEALGATVLKHGAWFDESREYAERLAAEKGMYYVHAANEPLLVAGVATYSLEIHEDLGEIDYIVVPVGAGSGASGACIVSDAVSPGTKVIGVQTAEAPAAQRSWAKREGSMEKAGMNTAAEGLATASGYEYPIGMLRRRLSDFVLVSEQRIEEAIVLFLNATCTLVEHAGAASLAAALDLSSTIKGKRVVLVASGANVNSDQLRSILART